MTSQPTVYLNQSAQTSEGAVFGSHSTAVGKRRKKLAKRQVRNDLFQEAAVSLKRYLEVILENQPLDTHDALTEQALKHLKAKLNAASPGSPFESLTTHRETLSEPKDECTQGSLDASAVPPSLVLRASLVKQELLQKSQSPVEFTKSDGFRTDKETYETLKQHFPEIVLFSPQIPPNTGSVARMCAAFAVRLHLIEPLGFSLSEKALRRAGLDYWDEVETHVHGSLDALRDLVPDRRWVFVETGGEQSPSEFEYQTNDLIVLGSETTGLPQEWMEKMIALGKGVILTIPMYSQKVRSINLSCATAMVLFQATEQMRRKRPSSESKDALAAQ